MGDRTNDVDRTDLDLDSTNDVDRTDLDLDRRFRRCMFILVGASVQMAWKRSGV